MRHLCDLHVHSTASDGSLAPHEVVELADRIRLAGVALTDHDTIEGLAGAVETAAGLPELTLLCGVEVSATWPQGTLHILGLCIDPASPSLAGLLARFRSSRNERNPKIVANLQALGVNITMDDVLTEAGSADPSQRVVSRAHMAAVLTKKGYARDFSDAFDRYIGTDAPAYVRRERIVPAEVIGAIHDAGGLAIVAHPAELQFANFAECETIVRSLRDVGLDGLEAYHSDHNNALVRFLLDLAKKLDLVVSGGSDFHGAVKPHVRLGRPRVPATVMDPIRARTSR